MNASQLEIHRAKPFVKIGNRTVKLSPREHYVITTLAMLDNKLTPYDLLSQLLTEYHMEQDIDKNTIWRIVSRLRKKIGTEYVSCRRWQGYILTANVRFVE